MTRAVYCVRNTVTGDRYIGSSVSAEKRLRSWMFALLAIIHKTNARYGVNKPMQQSAIKYGINVFAFGILEDCTGMTHEELRAREQYWIDRLQPTFNVRPVRPGPCDTLMDRAEARRKLIAS